MPEPSVHADLYQQLAEVAKTSETPWDQFEYAIFLGFSIIRWEPCSRHECFRHEFRYRRKPQLKKTRKVKMFGWFTGITITLRIEHDPVPHGWKRAPSKDEEIEVEE